MINTYFGGRRRVYWGQQAGFYPSFGISRDTKPGYRGGGYGLISRCGGEKRGISGRREGIGQGGAVPVLIPLLLGGAGLLYLLAKG